MGFHNDAFATVWQVEPVKDTMTKAKITISKKNNNTKEYETDFSGFVTFLGTAAASKAAKLKERDRIKLISTDVGRKWDADKGKEYFNFKVFSFEMADSRASSPPVVENTEAVDNGEVETDDYPF